MMKLFCAIVGVAGSAFSVKVDEGETVDDLKKAIKAEKMYQFPADELRLFLAKQPVEDESGKEVVPVYRPSAEEMKEEKLKWLPDEHRAALKLVEGESDDYIHALTAGEPILGSKTLTTWFDTKNNMELPSSEQIHVLVVVPKGKNDRSAAMAIGEAPSLPPTTIHRHPERLKRWAAINAMIRQKNQEANQKTTSEDTKKTSKKRKNHDIDKTVGYSSLCWEDIKPIYNFDDSFDLQPSDIPDADIELLLARIRDLRELYGQISDGKEAKRLFFIAPILETVSRLLKNVRILVEEDVVGKNVLLKGRFEFVLKRGTKRISLVEAKREDMLQGMVQNVTGLEALADVEDLTETYGIVTNFLEWKFLISGDEKVREHETVLPQANTIPSFEGLKEIVGKIYAMLQ
uniref:Crinkler n=1 Tax=Phytophthora capsici TaxID=4784 RepID=T2FFR6_PHYCP|nr:crinkler [Phytophthora capsici]